MSCENPLLVELSLPQVFFFYAIELNLQPTGALLFLQVNWAQRYDDTSNMVSWKLS